MFFLLQLAADDSIEVKTNTELAALYSAPKKRRRSSDDSSVIPSSGNPKKDHGSFDSDEDLRSNGRETPPVKKQVLSPSKSTNQAQSRKTTAATADDALAVTEQEPEPAEEKENSKKSLTPKRNKFAVSALVKRARFSLDAPALPNIKVEVKSR